MVDVLMSLLVIGVFALITSVVAGRFPEHMRRWLWFAFGEYVLASGAQIIYQREISPGDSLIYGQTGQFLAHILGANFEWAFPEVIKLLIHEPSSLDLAVPAGGGTNTSSMHAFCGLVVFIVGGSDVAAHVFVSMLAFCGLLSVYTAFVDAYPEAVPHRLFAATVMVPSVAFWTSALHKESLCVIGFGLIYSAWKSVRRQRFGRAVLLAPIGIFIVGLFRTPALAPLAMGLGTFFVLERTRKLKGTAGQALLGPVYLASAIGAVVLGMFFLAKYAPELGVDQLSETVRSRQAAWTSVAGGGSDLSATEDSAIPTTLAGQALKLPAGLANALFRPQIFDIRNPSMFISALEMTVLTVILVRALLLHGVAGTVRHIRNSAFLSMCMVTALLGCALVGLVTRNLGSLARYRTPFLPFYCAAMMSVAYIPSRKRLPAGIEPLAPPTSAQ